MLHGELSSESQALIGDRMQGLHDERRYGHNQDFQRRVANRVTSDDSKRGLAIREGLVQRCPCLAVPVNCPCVSPAHGCNLGAKRRGHLLTQ